MANGGSPGRRSFLFLIVLMAASSFSHSGSADSKLSASLDAWLAAYESSLPRRILAHQCVFACEDSGRLAVVPQFTWLDFAEDGLLPKLLRSPALLRAVVDRMRKLTAAERARESHKPLGPADGPLSLPAILIHLICKGGIPMMRKTDPTGSMLRELLSAATAPMVAPLMPTDPWGGPCIPEAFEAILRLPTEELIRAALLLHEAGIRSDSNGASLTLRLIRERNWRALQRWLMPDNAHFSMPLGWLGERDAEPALGRVLESIPRHPHLPIDTRCDLWDALCRHTLIDRGSPSPFVELAIDWHYATVTPRLREALSAHLIPDLHAEVQSWLMPPSTLKDPVPPVDLSLSPPFVLLDSVIDRCLRGGDEESVAELWRAQQLLREAAVDREFAERALQSKLRLLLLPP